MAPWSMVSFIRRQFYRIPAVEPVDLSDRVVIVSGSNVGLGKEAARHLANMKPKTLILAVRNTEKGDEAAKDIAATSGHTNVQVWKLDQSSFASVKAFIERAYKELDRLDVCLLNAGIATPQWRVTEDGWEETIQVNDITTSWLALRLLPLMKKTAGLPGSSAFKPHLTIVGSDVHYMAQFVGRDAEKPLSYLNDKSKHDPGDRYNISKLLNVFMGREVGKVAGTTVNVNVVNPGLCHSALSRDSGIGLEIMKFVLARSTEVGSRTLIWAATHDTPSGVFTSDCQVTEESDFALSEEGKKTQARFWAELMDILKKEDPKVASV